MVERVIRVFCEWDIGQDYTLFLSENVARIWAGDMLKDFIEDEGESIDSLEDEGLLSFEWVDVV